MGNPVTVVVKPSSRQGVLSFELNRSITGMGHRSYFFTDQKIIDSATNRILPNESEDADIADMVARQIFKLCPDNAKSVHINSNIVTLQLLNSGAEAVSDQISEMLTEMFLHYKPDKSTPDSQ